MIDTIKLGIPLTESQFNKLQQLLLQDENWQWVQFQKSSGELRFLRHRGLAQFDQYSFHRNIYWDIPQNFAPEQCYLTLEFSIPKFWYGHNIHLLYGCVVPLRQLKKLLEVQLHCKFVDVLEWQVWRVDLCYAWRLPSQLIAQQMLDSLKRLNFPYKKPIIYPTSLVFPGKTYSIKFYLKLPEFVQHDRKVLLKDKASLEWINHLEELSKGVLRFESTLRRRFLKRKGINTLEDLFVKDYSFSWNPTFFCDYPDIVKEENHFIEGCALGVLSALRDGACSSTYIYLGLGFGYIASERALYYATDEGDMVLVCELLAQDVIVNILETFLKKFLGDNREMQHSDVIEAKLFSKYDSRKAGHLMGLWLFVQKNGREKARQVFGSTNFYRYQQEMKAAGCNFVEPPIVTKNLSDFLKIFKLEVPSDYVTNKFDDFRDSGNILNLLPEQDV